MAAGASFEEFYAATVDRLLGHLFLVTGDLHAAEEIVQEAFTRPWCCTTWPTSR
jgi:RNA polymerase sigma-70 factor (ECF subfamily)